MQKSLHVQLPLILALLTAFSGCSREPSILDDPAKSSFVMAAPDNGTSDKLRTFLRALINHQFEHKSLRSNLVARVEAPAGKLTYQEVVAELYHLLPVPPDADERRAFESGRPGYFVAPVILGGPGEEFVSLRWMPVSELKAKFQSRN